jgi:eukaryotic-like serine/threonine-protein kinase
VVEREPGGRWGWALLVALLLAAAGVGAYLLTRPEQATVPTAVGKPVPGAATLVTNAGFKVHIEYVPSTDTKKNIVVRQDPFPGKKADKGSTVDLTVSTGPGTKPIPDVDGKGRLQAGKLLKKAGFKFRFVEQASDEIPEFHVIEARPSSGSDAEIGSRVTLVVSTGKEKVSVPAVVGKDVNAAQAQLEDAGFVVSTHEQVTDKKEPGTVLKQDPAAGTPAPKGTRIQLTVAKASEKVEVPGVVGLPEEDAISNIEGLGLTPDVRDVPVTDPDQDGKVLSQNPPARSKRAKGSRVIIRVGRLQEEPTDTTTTPTP